MPGWLRKGLLPPLAYMGLIFWLSSLEDLSLLPGEVRESDKTLHGIEYAILGALWFRALAGPLVPSRALLAAFLVSALYGVSDELHQRFVPGRNCDGWDMLADAMGALVGASLLWALSRRRARDRCEPRPDGLQ